MNRSLIEILTEMEEQRKQRSKSLLDQILADYEKENKNNQESETWTEADYELNEYLTGDGDVVHLYNYYNLINNG